MTHYWTAKAIVQRIGLRDARRVPYLINRAVGQSASPPRDADGLYHHPLS